MTPTAETTAALYEMSETQSRGKILKIFAEADITLSTEPLRDDGENLVEVDGVATVKTAADAARVVALAKQHQLGVMTVGSLTSAVDAFKAGQLHGLKGWIGLRINPNGSLTTLQEIEQDERYESIPVLNGRARILKSKNPKKYPHRIQTWAGVAPAELDEVLMDELGRGCSVYVDLTTRNDAQIGAVVATGGQGPNRADASFNMHGIVLIDFAGRTQHLTGDEAKKHIGLNGASGAIAEVDMEVIQEEPHEFGLFIPLAGSLGHGLTKSFPEVMAALAKFTEGEWIETERGRVLKAKHGDLLVRGFEILTRRDIHATYERMSKMPPSAATGCVGAMYQFMREKQCETGIMINCRTSLEREQLTDCLGCLASNTTADESSPSAFMELRRLMQTETVHPDIDGIIPFFDEHMASFREARESVAVTARESKKEGPTRSTDLNLHITCTDPDKIIEAYRRIWAIYNRYIQFAEARDANINIYGHNHPGNGAGGGVDAHIRVTFPLEEQDHQRRAAENVVALTDRQSLLYEELLALDGQCGIQVRAGEKGRLSTPEYTAWLEEHRPEEAKTIWETIQRYGGATFGARTEKFKLHAYPPRMQGGLLNYFAADPSLDPSLPLLERLNRSILLWCQNSHRSPDGERVFCEVLGLLRDYLGLQFDERLFFAESADKAVHIAKVSLNDYQASAKVLDLRGQTEPIEDTSVFATVIVDDPAQLDDPRFTHCKKILCVRGTEIVSANTRKKADIIVYSAEAFGTGGEMGIIVTSANTVRHAGNLRTAGNNTGYVHSIVELNRHPHSTIETPKMQMIAELGCLLAQRLEQTSSLTITEAEAILEKQKRFLTLNPGPSQLHPHIVDKCADISREASSLAQAVPQERIPRIERVKQKLKIYLGIPPDYEIFFGGSATQAMEQIVESLGLDWSIVLNMGAFGDRQQKVVQRFSNPGARVKPVQMRWGAGPNTELRSITAEIKSNQPPRLRNTSCGLFMTGHETSTGVWADVSALMGQLHPDILKIVDGTSEIGAIPRDFRDIDVYFGSVQKFFGVPSGLSVIFVSPRAMQQAKTVAAKRKKNQPPAYRTFPEMTEETVQGRFHNLRGILQLEKVLDDFTGHGGIEILAAETRRRMRCLMDTVERSPHLAPAYPKITTPGVDPKADWSPILAHIVPVDRVVGDIRRRLREQGIEIGAGYGPLARETMRAYLTPNIPPDQFARTLEALQEAVQYAIETLPNRPLMSTMITPRDINIPPPGNDYII